MNTRAALVGSTGMGGLAIIAAIWFGGDVEKARQVVPAECVAEDAGPIVCTCRDRDGNVIHPGLPWGTCECKNERCTLIGPAGRPDRLVITKRPLTDPELVEVGVDGQ